jgi:PPOX class probable F420-dependent enzyme
VRTKLSLADLGDLLDLPLVAVLATNRKDGGVLLSPVWHEWRDGAFHVVTGRDDVKVRHLHLDPRATILVYEQDPPYRGAEVRGRASVTEEGAHEASVRVAIRYLGERRGRAFAGEGGDDALIRIEPDEVRAWDFADDDSLS